jgi:hypothetical protein
MTGDFVGLTGVVVLVSGEKSPPAGRWMDDDDDGSNNNALF